MTSVQSTLSPERSGWVRKRDNSNWSRSRRSLFQRMISGCRKARCIHKQVWFVTLTTSEVCNDVINGVSGDVRGVFKRDFSTFVKRCRRRFGRFEYLAVHTSEGYGVYHLLVNSVSIGRNFSFGGYFGFKAFWFWCSEQWLDIHYSPVVWAVLLRGLRKAVNYVIGHYLGGQKGYLRYHWSWNWVYVGFVRDWYSLCRKLKYDFKRILPIWNKQIFEKSLYVSLPQISLPWVCG